MNSITLHCPSFMKDEDYKPEEFEFDGVDELINLDRVKNFSDTKGFFHYAISNNLLMAIYLKGFEWWVIGSIKNPNELDLEKWNGGKYLVDRDGEIQIIESDDVYCTYGDKVELSSGETLTEIDARSERGLEYINGL